MSDTDEVKKKICDIDNAIRSEGYMCDVNNDRNMWEHRIKQIRDEIEHLHYHPKLDFIKNDEVLNMVLDIIDKYK